MAVTEFTKQDYELIAAEYAALRKAAVQRCARDKEIAVIDRAFEFANQAHQNIRRRSGEPYIIHPIAVAKIVVSDIGLGYKSIAAALLHDVVEDTDYTVEDIRSIFGDKIASLVDGLTKIKTVLDNRKDGMAATSAQAENFKRILLTLNDDVRVVLIKLADRLHNCRTIEYMPEYKRDKILSETMFIFIPLAHRLGLYEVKSEMENIWLKYKDPDVYNSISERLDADKSDREKEIDDFIMPIRTALQDAGFNFEIRKRVKTPYSIWHKMNTKNITFEQIYDLYAVRVVFTPPENTNETERDQCYHIFSIITGIYRYKPDRVRDWVKHPKGNGYEALHCTLMSESGVWVEVQIRSKRMDDIAEKGIAAHWAYKREGYISENDSEMDKWLERIREILVSPDVNALELLDIIHKDLVTSEIMVFTPKGEQRSVPKGSTVLDFAYQIHSEIGNTSIAGKVNLKLVPLSHILKTGDTVEIITAEDQAPKLEWLSFLKTRHARNIVIDWFRPQKPAFVKKGKETVDSVIKSGGFLVGDAMYRHLLTSLELGATEELFFRTGLGLISPMTLSDLVSKAPKSAPKGTFDRFLKWWRNNSSSKPKSKYVLADCCNPIPGDAVLAFREDDGTITVHKKSCEVAENLASKFGESILVPDWAEISGEHYSAKISIKGLDRVGLLNDVTRVISLVMGINILKLELDTRENLVEGRLQVSVNDKSILNELITKLESIDGIQSVTRSEL